MTESLVVSAPWPGFTARTFAVNGDHVLSANVGGPQDGPAVLLLHSILTSSAIWRRQAERLASRGMRVICLDMRGHGRSDCLPGPCTMDDLVADAIAVLDALEIERAHVVGVSQGGMIALGLAVHHLSRLASLVVVAARSDAPKPFADAWNDRIAKVEAEGSVSGLARVTVERWFGGQFMADQKALAASLEECIKLTSPGGFTGCARAIQGLDYLQKLPEITVPLTFIIGTNDVLLLEPMRELAAVMSADLVEIPNAGHLPMLDHAEAFDEAILRHFGKTR